MSIFAIVWAVVMFIISIILFVCAFLVLKGYHIFMSEKHPELKQQRNFRKYYAICYFLLVLFFMLSGILILVYRNNNLGIWISVTVGLIGIVVGFIYFNFMLSNDSDDCFYTK